MGVWIWKTNSKKKTNYVGILEFVSSHYRFAEFCCDTFSTGLCETDIERFHLPDEKEIDGLIVAEMKISRNQDINKRLLLLRACKEFGKRNAFDTEYSVSW